MQLFSPHNLFNPKLFKAASGKVIQVTSYPTSVTLFQGQTATINKDVIL